MLQSNKTLITNKSCSLSTYEMVRLKLHSKFKRVLKNLMKYDPDYPIIQSAQMETSDSSVSWTLTWPFIDLKDILFYVELG